MATLFLCWLHVFVTSHGMAHSLLFLSRCITRADIAIAVAISHQSVIRLGIWLEFLIHA